MMEINDTAQTAYEAARKRGHFQDGTSISGYFARIHSDLGRALDAHRRGDSYRKPETARPTGPDSHLADAAIRVMTLSCHLGLDLENGVLQLIESHSQASGDTELEERARRHYARRYGDPSAATFDEMIWDGHQTVAQASEPIVRAVLEMEAHGLRPEEAEEATKERIALDMAEILAWALGTGHQRNASLLELIRSIIAADAEQEGATI